MSDIKLTMPAGDIDLSTGTIELAEDADAIRQNIMIRMRMFQGEWHLDTRVGMPYFQSILGQKFKENLIGPLFREAILGTAGVVALPKFTMSFSARTRQMSVTFTAETKDGVAIEFKDFIIGLAGET